MLWLIELYERTETASNIKYETANIGREFREIMDEPQNESVTTSVNALGGIKLKD